MVNNLIIYFKINTFFIIYIYTGVFLLKVKNKYLCALDNTDWMFIYFFCTIWLMLSFGISYYFVYYKNMSIDEYIYNKLEKIFSAILNDND